MHPYLHIGSISLPAYGVFCALGIVVSCVMTLFRARRFGIRADRMLFVYTAALVCGLLGAAFTYMLITYSPQELFSMLRRGAFLREYQPGYVFYGGFLLGAAAALLAARVVKTPVRALSRALLPCLPFAHALGRVGCFFAGCCYGREARWLPGVMYPENTEWVGAPAGIPLVPAQLIEAALLLAIGAILLRRARNPRANLLRDYIRLYAPVRFFMEFLRGDAIRGAFLFLSTSQWIGLALLALTFLPVSRRRARE